MDIMQIILNNIDEELKSRHWEHKDLTYNSTLSSSSVSQWFRRKMNPSLKNLIQVSEILGVSLSRLTATSTYEKFNATEVELVNEYEKLSEGEQVAVLNLLKEMNSKMKID